MTELPDVLNVRFFRTDAGNEPVREWLTDMPREHRRTVGVDIKTVQLGWPNRYASGAQAGCWTLGGQN